MMATLVTQLDQEFLPDQVRTRLYALIASLTNETDYNGVQISLDNLQGKVRMKVFVYVHSPEVDAEWEIKP